MEDSEARQLLLDAGVPEEMIGHETLNLASAIGDGIAHAVAKKIAEKLVEAEWPAMIREMEACRARYAELGIKVNS